MTDKIEYKETAIEAIKQRIKVLNGIVLIIISVILFVIVKFTYEFLDYVPLASVITMLSIVAGLTLTSIVVAKTISNNAIKAIDEYSSKLHAVLTTSRKIHEILYIDVLLDSVMDISLKITGADGGSVLLVEKDNLVFKVVKGSEAEKLTGFSIPKSRGIAGWVVDNSSLVRVDDVQEDDRFYSEVDRATGYETRSLLCVPLRLSAGTIGALELVNKNIGAFSIEDEELLSYFADQAAISIERVRFYEDEKNFEIHFTNILANTSDKMVAEKRGHSRRVARYTLLMADVLNMSEEDKKRLYRASLLHDIGFLKIGLKDVMSLQEYKAHSRVGYEMLEPISFYADVAPIVLHHHECYDGSGYPSGLKGDSIPLEARLIAIAEAFDSMVSKDSYKYKGKVFHEGPRSPILGFHNAIFELRKNAGIQFDPELVKVFTENISEDDLEEK